MGIFLAGRPGGLPWIYAGIAGRFAAPMLQVAGRWGQSGACRGCWRPEGRPAPGARRQDLDRRVGGEGGDHGRHADTRPPRRSATGGGMGWEGYCGLPEEGPGGAHADARRQPGADDIAVLQLVDGVLDALAELLEVLPGGAVVVAGDLGDGHRLALAHVEEDVLGAA